MATRNACRGLTIIELLVAMSIGSLLMLAAFDMVRMILSHVAQQPLSIGEVDQARSVAMKFTDEIRNATTGNDGSFALAQASTTQIIFFSPYGSNSSTTINRFRYYVASSTLYKGVTVPTGSPLTYVLANERVTPVLYGVANATSSVFTYYNGSYNGSSTPLVQPVNVTQVTFVQISLAILKRDLRNATTTFALTTGSAVRSLKTNLGN